ncbi:MAG: hypothetical protein LAP61_09680 [Acidobacteriia bacterium]|nr:hypothetical protein [Terriglobia bacterium]
MRYLARKIIVLIGLVLPSIAASQDPQVSVNPNPARTETVYNVDSGSCHIQWTLQHSPLNEGIILQRSKCSLAIRQQMPLLAKILEKVLADPSSARSFRTLSVGRLNSLPEMPERLATLAASSEQWDRRAGRPKSGNINAFIQTLVAQKTILGEWQALFEKFGRHIEVSGVETVLVSAAGDLPFFKALQARGIAARDKLPYDCAVWFAVKQP